jgi:hypothetical protein
MPAVNQDMSTNSAATTEIGTTGLSGRTKRNSTKNTADPHDVAAKSRTTSRAPAYRQRSRVSRNIRNVASRIATNGHIVQANSPK